jgi:peptidoglycan/xylan/chitin deacetylase (PgdA/CDA1 family)
MAKWLHTVRQFFEHKAVVLMYHRVAVAGVDPWQLAVSPAHFEEQVARLSKNFNVVPVSELIHNLQQQQLPATSVCITFDDGYTDNYLAAAPILERYGCPATFFIPSQYIGQEQPFWWDELEQMLLSAPKLPQLFQMPMPEEQLVFDLGADAVLTSEHLKKHEAWHYPEAAPTQRCALFLKIWELLRPLPLPEIGAAVAAIKQWAGYNPVLPDAMRPMRSEQLAELSKHPLFSIGLHTTTHPALAYHPEELQYAEIAENKKALQPYHPLNAVAFPYGNYNNSTLSVLQKQRLDAGFTTEEKRLTPQSNPHCLGRFQVKNWNGPAFEKQVLSWLKD